MSVSLIPPPVTVALPVITGRLRNRSVIGWTFATSTDLDRLGRVELRKGSHGYAVIRGPKRDLFHRAILGLTSGDGVVVDHVDRNKLNCTSSNLRTGTQAENMQNQARTHSCGAYPLHKRWGARAKRDGKAVHLGVFDTKEEAAEAARLYRRTNYRFATEP